MDVSLWCSTFICCCQPNSFLLILCVRMIPDAIHPNRMPKKKREKISCTMAISVNLFREKFSNSKCDNVFFCMCVFFCDLPSDLDGWWWWFGEINLFFYFFVSFKIKTNYKNTTIDNVVVVVVVHFWWFSI